MDMSWVLSVMDYIISGWLVCRNEMNSIMFLLKWRLGAYDMVKAINLLNSKKNDTLESKCSENYSARDDNFL